MLLVVADRLIEQEDWAKSANYLSRYLAIYPDDASSKIKFAQVIDKTAVAPSEIQQAISLLQLAVSACESTPGLVNEIPAIRHSMVTRMMQVGRYEDALEQIAKLAGPKVDLDLERNLAMCRYRLASEKRSTNIADSSKTALPRWFSGLLELNIVDLLLKAYVDNPQNMEIWS